MSPTWRREDTEDLVESRRIRAELAESANILTLVTQRLLALAAELNAEAEAADAQDEEEGHGR